MTKHLKFTESISPICLHFLEGGRKYVSDNINGHFSGWGITEKQELSDVLRRVNMKTLAYSNCAERIKKNVNYDLPADKFCVINDYGSTACRGDSGGGFVVETIQQQNREYRLLGILSNVPWKAQDCSRDTLVVMTNVQFYETLIKNVLNSK